MPKSILQSQNLLSRESNIQYPNKGKNLNHRSKNFTERKKKKNKEKDLE